MSSVEHQQDHQLLQPDTKGSGTLGQVTSRLFGLPTALRTRWSGRVRRYRVRSLTVDAASRCPPAELPNRC